jgi:hypothetical protein
MHRGSPILSLFLALMGILLSSLCLAQEPNFCKSVCDSERRACKADVQQLAAEDGDGLFNMTDHNQLARTAAKTQGPSAATLAGERAGVNARRIARSAGCDDTYLRCTRTCASPGAKSVVSPVLTEKRKNG